MKPSVSRAGTSEPFELQVSKGEIAYHAIHDKFASIASQDTTEAIINEAGYIPAYQQAAGVVKVSSADANDTSAGTGARTVQITGYLADYTSASETVTLTGQTAVNTTNSYIRVTEIKVLTVGAGGSSAGIIYAGTGTVTGGVPATVYLRCPASTAVNGTNVSLGAYYIVPAGYDLFIDSLNLTAGVSSNTATLLFKFRALTSATWTTYYSWVTTVNGSDHPRFTFPLHLDEGYEYCVTSDASATTISASAHIYGILLG